MNNKAACDSSPKLFVDGKEIPWSTGIEIVYDGVWIPGEDDPNGTLNIRATDEGLIMDVWGSKVEHLDTNFGTSSETADEITARLCDDND